MVLSELFWSLRRLKISSTTAIDNADFPEGIAVKTLLFGRIFAKFEDLGVVHIGDQILRFFAELVDFLCLAQVPKEGLLVLMALELFDQLLDLVLACCISAARLQKEVLQIFCGPQCGYKFPRNCSSHLMVPKMISRLGFVDLADHTASSILTKLVALSELNVPSGRARPEFSCILLSQCKLQAVCCRERYM